MLPVSIVASGLLLCLMTRARLPRAVALAICTSIFFGLTCYLVIVLSWGLGAEAFDESVVYHVISGYSGVPKGILIPVLIATAVGLAAFAALCAWLYSRSRNNPRSARLALPVLLLSPLAFFTNPVVADLASSGYFSLTESATQPPEYKAATGIALERKPNVVYLYLESLERTFLNEKIFPGLTPNLKRLDAEAISFTNIQQTYGTGWTMAGMVASQCGIPLSTDIWNSMSGLDRFLPGAICLGDLLSAQGYALEYLGGADIAFGGKGDFYRSHGFKRVEGQSELAGLLGDPAYQNDWGLYDDSMFEIFKQRFDELAAKGQPFGLFALTNSTHPPDGNLPKTCTERYGDGADHILDAVLCTDRYVGEVVEHIRRSSAADNTLIVIGSDHLAMHSRTTDRWLRKQTRRDLLLMLAPHAAPERIDRPGTTLDVAPTLLGLISNGHAVGFGTDLRSGAKTLLQDKIDLHRFLMSKVPFLNTLWKFPSLAGDLTIDPVQADVSTASRHVRLPVLFLLDKDLKTRDVIFPGRNDFYGLSSYVARLPQAQRFLWIDYCGELSWLNPRESDWNDDGFCVTYGALDDDDLPITRLGRDRHQFNLEEAAGSANDGGDRQASYRKRQPVLERIRRYGTANLIQFASTAPAARDYAVVAAAGAGRSSFIEYRGHKKYLDPGVTVIDFPSGASEPRLRHTDLCAKEPAGKAADAAPEQAAGAVGGTGAPQVIVKTPVGPCDGGGPHGSPVAGEILARWKDVGAADAYIGIVSARGPAAEYALPPGTALAALAVSAADHDARERGPAVDAGVLSP